MSAKPFHLGWFVDNYRAPSWNGVWSGADDPTDWMGGDFYVDMARSLERARFDFMLVADSAYVADAYQGSMEVSLKYGVNAPKGDPSALVMLMAQATQRLGFLPTLSVTEWRPFQVARFISTADHLSRGRMGWNVVTSGNVRAAENFGVDEVSHDERYDLGDEFVEIVTKLWDSWEPDAVVMDHESGYYADHTKVHPINYEGTYFRSRGPLTTSRSPQGRPVICQAGTSSRGKQFAATHAEIIVLIPDTVEEMISYRNDIRGRMVDLGRDPDACKILYIVSPTLAETDGEARERARLQRLDTQESMDVALASASRHLMIDLSKLDLDEPLPDDLTTEGHAGQLAEMISSGKTLRELMTHDLGLSGSTEMLVGSPATVAAKMDELMQEVGGDGFMFLNLKLTRHYINQITDGLVPALQRRGLTRTDYEFSQLRQNLFAF